MFYMKNFILLFALTGNIYSQNDSINFQLLKSISERKIEDVKNLIETGANTNYTDEKGITPLALSASNADISISKLLIQNGADINMQCGYRQTPIHYAILSNDTNIVEFFIENGANINNRIFLHGYYGDYPIVTALRENRNFNFIRFLLRNHAKTDYESNDLFYYSVQTGDVRILDLMIKNGINTKEIEPVLSSSTPEILDFLLKNKIVSVFSKEFKEELYRTIIAGSYQNLNTMLENGGFLHFSVLTKGIIENYRLTYGWLTSSNYMHKSFHTAVKYFFFDILFILIISLISFLAFKKIVIFKFPQILAIFNNGIIFKLGFYFLYSVSFVFFMYIIF